MIQTYHIVVLTPYVSALLLVAIPGYRIGSVVNVLASAVTFAAGLMPPASPESASAVSVEAESPGVESATTSESSFASASSVSVAVVSIAPSPDASGPDV